VWAWGSGAGYKLGLGDQKDRYDPVLVPRLKEKIVLQVSAGAWHSLAIVLYPPMLGGGTVRLPPSSLLTSLSSLPPPLTKGVQLGQRLSRTARPGPQTDLPPARARGVLLQVALPPPSSSHHPQRPPVGEADLGGGVPLRCRHS
jgi:hypothetical protein